MLMQNTGISRALSKLVVRLGGYYWVLSTAHTSFMCLVHYAYLRCQRKGALEEIHGVDFYTSCEKRSRRKHNYFKNITIAKTCQNTNKSNIIVYFHKFGKMMINPSASASQHAVTCLFPSSSWNLLDEIHEVKLSIVRLGHLNLPAN